jgi:hypothetical protein
MALPQLVTAKDLETAANKVDPWDLFTGNPPRERWEPVLVWSASQFQDENLMFLLAAKEYARAPNQGKMDYIYKEFIGRGSAAPGVKSKATVVRGLQAPREINIASAARDTTFERVTGARTRSGPNGCRPDAFDDAVWALGQQLKFDINGRFWRCVQQDAKTAFRMKPGQAAVLEKELNDLKQLGARF